MQILFLKGESASDLLKATTLQEITVPAYTRSDGTYVPQHRKMVHVNSDRTREDVLAGRGSHSQREAHARLHRMAGFADMPEDHRYAHILSHATGIQNRRSAAAQMSGWRSRARGGQNPTPAQWQAFYQLSREQQAAELAQVPDQSRLSAPPREIASQADPVEAQLQADAAQAQQARAELRRHIEAAGQAFSGLGMTRSDDGSWVYRRRGDGNESRSVRVKPVAQGSGLQYIVTRSGSFNSTLGGNAMPDVEVGRYSADMAALDALQTEIAAINRHFNDQGAARTAAPADQILSSALEFRGIRYRHDDNGWRMSRDGGERWGTVRSPDAIAALNRGEDPNPSDERTTPTPHRGASTKPVRLNDMTMDRQPDGSWLTRGGVVNGVGSALAIAADVMAGVAVPVAQIHAYTEGARLRAVDALVRAGRDPEEMLNKLLPDSTDPASGRREGETKTVMGRTYVLRDGRWHRQDQDPETAPTYRISDQEYRQSADGGWEMKVGTGWTRVRNLSYIDRLNRMRERGQTASAASAPMTPAPTGDIPANRFEMVGEGHNKFWTIAVRGNQVITHWGRIGTRGQTKVETVGSHERAMALMGEKIGMKRRGGYAEAGNSTIPLDVLPSDGASSRIILPQAPAQAAPAAPAPASVQSVAATDTTGPAAAPLPANEQAAIRSAMAIVQIPDGVSRWSNSATNQQALRRINQLQELARLGDLDGVTNFSTSRSRSNYALVDDYRSALLAAAHNARAAAAPAPAPAANAPIPLPPAISGANPNNTALIAAQRKVAALYAAAQSADPVAALLAIPTSRGNGYMNRADDYKTALLRHFNHDHAGNATSEAAVRPAAPAVRSVSTAPARAPAAPPASDANLPVDQNPAFAANPDRKTAAQLGFIPRPNVPLDWTVRVEGVNHPTAGLIPWPDPKMADLARRYLAQPTTKQQSAKQYQARVASRLSPLHPAFRDVQARAAQIAQERAARERAEAAARAAREEEERRTMMERARGTTRKFLDKLQALPDIHKPQAPVGANISSYSGEFDAAGAKLGLTGPAMKEVVGRLVADYGSGVIFTASVSVSGSNVEMYFRGNDGTKITRVFKKGGDGKYFVYHSYFEAGNRGQGAGKALFRTSLGVYKSLGMTRIDVFANIDVGGYAWAKFGFMINESEWHSMRNNFKRRVNSMTLSAKAKTRLIKILDDPSPRALFALSDLKDGERNIGKEFLLGYNWHGTLDLSDDFMHRRCIGYISQGRN